MKQSILKGALVGLLSWLVYGIVEFVLSVIIPNLWGVDARLLDWQRPLAGLLFVVYALAGTLLGAAGGAWLAWSGKSQLPGRHATIASLTLTLAFIANLAAAWPLARSETIALAVAGAMALLFGCALASETWYRRTAFLANPWMLSLLLLVGPWVSREALAASSPATKTGMSLAAMGGVAAIAAVLQRILPWRPHWKTVAGAALALMVWIGLQGRGTTASIPGNSGAASSGAGKPNILLITMDTVRADHLAVYGYGQDTTPQLREFARGATVYERAIASASFTLPTHASLFTGRYPAWHGATVQPRYPLGAPLPPDVPTLAGVLRANGYWTAGVIANRPQLRAATGLARGFSYWDSRVPVWLTGLPFYLREGARKLLGLAFDTADYEVLCRRAADIDNAALELLKQPRDGRPFFLFLNYMDAHFPYNPPPAFRKRFRGSDAGFRLASELRPLTLAVNNGKQRLGTVERDYLMSQYDAGIAYMDSEIGALLARLRELGLYDNTLIAITADHGEAFGEHDRMQHAIGSLYQDQVHVPLIVKYPDQHEGERSDELASQVDFMPTALELAGLPQPRGLQGQSLRSPRKGDDDAVFAEDSAIGDQSANPRLRGLRRAVFTGPSAKLITWTAGPPELYDLSADPGELNNQFGSADSGAPRLMARMKLWTAAVPQQNARPGAEPDAATLKRLKSLGYVQ